MTQYALCKAIHEVYTSKEATETFRGGDFSLLDRFELTPAERTAIETKDLVSLWGFGVHPILLFHFSAVLNPRETYIREVVPNIQGVPNSFYDYYRLRSQRPATPPSADESSQAQTATGSSGG